MKLNIFIHDSDKEESAGKPDPVEIVGEIIGHEGLKFFIHTGKDFSEETSEVETVYHVTEYSTGFRFVGYIKSLKEVKPTIAERFKDIGTEKVKKKIKETAEEYGIINL